MSEVRVKMRTMVMALMTLDKGREEKTAAESERVRDNDAGGEKEGKGERREKEGGRGVKWDYVVLRKKPGEEARRWDYTIEMKGERRRVSAKASGKTGKDEKTEKKKTKMEEVWDYSMEINSPEGVEK